MQWNSFGHSKKPLQKDAECEMFQLIFQSPHAGRISQLDIVGGSQPRLGRGAGYKWVPCHAINLFMPNLMPPSRPTHDQSDN